MTDDMHRRRVALVYDIKAMIREAATGFASGHGSETPRHG